MTNTDIVARFPLMFCGSWNSARSKDVFWIVRAKGNSKCKNLRPSYHPTTTLPPLAAGSRYFIKFPFAVLLGIWSALFWRPPTAEDVVTFVEGTSLVTVLRRDRAVERAALAFSGEATRVKQRECEERHYYIQVDECMLEHVSRESGSRYNEGTVTPVKSWSMKYKKTRYGGEDGKWVVVITSFLVNGQPVADSESQVSFLHFYWTTAAHTKCHALGNALVERIVSDDSLKTKLMESTWTTTWLHHGLLHGSLGPLTSVRYGKRAFISRVSRLLTPLYLCHNHQAVVVFSAAPVPSFGCTRSGTRSPLLLKPVSGIHTKT